MRETRGEVPAEGDFKSTPALVQGRGGGSDECFQETLRTELGACRGQRGEQLLHKAQQMPS